jgi:hypothetical protein
MHKKPPRPANPDQESTLEEWMDALLLQDARHAAGSSDAKFVTSVMSRLRTAVHPPPARSGYSRTAWAYRLLVGFEALTLAAVCLSAPAALHTWMSFAAAPQDLSALLEPSLLGFMVGMAMVLIGAIELTREDNEHTHLI